MGLVFAFTVESFTTTFVMCCAESDDTTDEIEVNTVARESLECKFQLQNCN